MKNILTPIVTGALILASAVSSFAFGGDRDRSARERCQKDRVVREARPGCERAARERQCIESKHGNARELWEAKRNEARSCRKSGH